MLRFIHLAFMPVLLAAGGIFAYDVPNGSFEASTSGDIPAQWNFARSGNDAVVMRTVAEHPADGSRCLFIANPVPLTPQVYGALQTSVRLQPDVGYRLRCALRGDPGSGLAIALGQNWNHRIPLKKGGADWQTVEFPFTVQAGDLDAEGNSPLVIISEARTSGVWLDHLEIIPEQPEPRPAADAPPFHLEWAHKPDSRTVAGMIEVSGLVPGEVDLIARLRGADGSERTQLLRRISAPKPGMAYAASFWFPLDRLPVGEYELTFLAGTRELARFQELKIDLWQYERKRVAALAEQARELRRKAGANPVSSYIAIPLSILEYGIRQLQELQTAVASEEDRTYYLDRCALAVDGLEAIRNRIEADLKRPEPLPACRYVSSPVTLEGGRPYARMRTDDGVEAVGPVLFTGYGHFEDVVRDLPLLHRLGANIIQIEVGPAYVLPGPDLSVAATGYLKNYVLPALQSAWENDVKVNLLLSPHYTPVWWLEQHPELRSNSGFLNYEVNHPESRKMLVAYLDQVLPALAASPYREALQGITITNEPAYIGFDPANAFARDTFRRYLEEKFGSPEEFGRRTGLVVADWEELLDRDSDGPVFRYEFNRCKQREFAAFHAWFAAEVRKRLPDVPLMAKVMIVPALDPATLAHGVDPEAIGEVSDYQGNDNTMFPDNRHARFLVDWQSTALGHEFQLSTGGSGVVNSENHIIPDNVRTAMPPGHVYTATFQQYITGAVALATWVWVDITPANRTTVSRDLNYNIAQRPDAIEEQARALLDGNRLGREIAAFTDHAPEAALLYSSTAMILDGGDAFAALREWYRQSACSGYRVGFITEHQLEHEIAPELKLIVVPDSVHVNRAVLPRLRAFAARGGVLVGSSGALRRDEYDRVIPETELPPVRPLAPDGLTATLTQTLGELPVSVIGAETLFFRSVPYGTGQLINLVNYRTTAQPVRLAPRGRGILVNRLTEQPQPLAFELAPLQPLLLEWRPE